MLAPLGLLIVQSMMFAGKRRQDGGRAGLLAAESWRSTTGTAPSSFVRILAPQPLGNGGCNISDGVLAVDPSGDWMLHPVVGLAGHPCRLSRAQIGKIVSPAVLVCFKR